MHVDVSILVSVIIALFGFLAYLLRYMALGIKCLTELKKDVETIRENQKEIKEDFKQVEKKVYNIN